MLFEKEELVVGEERQEKKKTFEVLLQILLKTYLLHNSRDYFPKCNSSLIFLNTLNQS